MCIYQNESNIISTCIQVPFTLTCVSFHLIMNVLSSVYVKHMSVFSYLCYVVLYAFTVNAKGYLLVRYLFKKCFTKSSQ